MGLVLNTQRFSLHDGQGIRTLVFLKGCPLKCLWCSNPESQSPAPELAYSRDRCIGCKTCRDVCPKRAIRQDQNETIEIDWSLCDHCGGCARDCPSRALEILGRQMSAEEVLAIAERDQGFFARSGGGLTISGGEPLAQVDFVLQLLKKARDRGMHTAIETSGLCPFAALEEVCRLVDQLFYDIKCMDPDRHWALTGASNERVLENFANMRRRFPDARVVVRTPIVPGATDSPSEIAAVVDFVTSNGGASEYELLPYHRYGEAKYEKSGRGLPLGGMVPPGEEQLSRLQAIANRVGNSGDIFRAAFRSTV